MGTFSSAGGLFGFTAALVLVTLKSLHRRAKFGTLAVLALVGFLTYWNFMRVAHGEMHFGSREVMYVLTAFGAALWGSPVGLTQFGFDWRSAGGLAIVACTAAVVVRAVTLRRLPQLALALSITLLGYLCVVPIAMARPYLGNWHVQYALPAVCGAYATAYGLWKIDKSLFSAVPFFGLGLLLASSVFGYYQGFTVYGPDYRRYVLSIEHHVLRELEDPGWRTPYPPQGTNDIDADLTLFLAAHGHPLFTTSLLPAHPAPLPSDARVFVGNAQLARPWQVAGGDGKTAWLTVVLPSTSAAREISAKIGDNTVTLHRVHPQLTPEACGRNPDATYFAALIESHRLPAGQHALEFSVLE